MAAGAGPVTGRALLLGGLRQRRRPLARLLGWSALEAAPALLSGGCVAAALDRGFLAGRPWVGMAWLGVYGAALVARAVATRGMFAPLADTVEPIRDGLVRHVVTGAVGRATSGGAAGTGGAATGSDGASVTQLTEQVQPARGLIAAILVGFRQSAVMLLGALAGLAALAPAALFVVLPPVLLSLALFGWLLRSLGRRKRAVLLAAELVGMSAGRVLAGLRDVVACGGQQRAAAEVGAAVEASVAAQRAYARGEALRLLICAVGGSVPVVVLLLAAPRLLAGGLSAGDLVGAVTYVALTIDPALSSALALVATWGVQLGATMQRLAQRAAPADPPPGPVGPPPSGYDLTVEELTFRYGAAAEPVVDRLTLTIPAGDHLAVVGPSGVGKSTLANLLAGLLPAGEGEVRLGGRPVDRIDPGWLRRQVALVPQEAYVFAGTLRENLAYLSPSATDADLDRAVDALGLRRVVRDAGGYGAMLGSDGVTLSAGERQLITLARVYLSPARLVILDEGTCHLDPAAEATAEAALAARPGTLVVIAHRLSSALRATRILILDGDRAVLGDHAGLVAGSALYRDLIGHWAERPRADLIG